MVNRLNSGGRRLGFGLAAVAAVLTLGQGAGAHEPDRGTARAADGEFCGPRLAKDYLRPLTRMPPIRRVPASGKLSFGPAGLTLESRGGPLVVGGGSVGFGFSDDAVGQIRHLNWDVSVQLVRIDARGKTVATLGSKRRRIEAVRGNDIKDLLVAMSGRPAFYRVGIVFRQIGSNRILGQFNNYVRVVRPQFDVRLLVSTPVVHRDEVISARLANIGTETVSSISPDWRFSAQRLDGERWVPAAIDPPPEKQKPIIQKLAAGQMDSCTHLRVPSFEEPGRYRFSMVVNRSNPAKLEDRVVPVTAEFEIAGRVLK